MLAEDSNNPHPAPGWTTFGAGGGGRLASPAARVGARILDWVVIVIIGLPTAFVGGTAEMILLIPMVGALYEVTLIAMRGQTLGKMALRVKVVRSDNGLVPGWGKSIGRAIIPMTAVLIPVAGWIGALIVYVSLLWDDRRQGWHDKVAKTLVIQA